MPSQFEEDFIIVHFLGAMRNGLLIEVGAGHPTFQSNSDTLINDYDWSAVLVEARPEACDELRAWHAHNPKVRVVEAAIGRSGNAQLWSSADGFCSTTNEAFKAKLECEGVAYGSPVEVPVIDMAALLAKVGNPRVIDFLSVDIEGIDIEAIMTIPWGQVSIRLICVENTPFNAGADHYLARRGYTMVGLTKANRLFGKV